VFACFLHCIHCCEFACFSSCCVNFLGEHYGGSDVCGARGSPISMKDLVCKGGELDIKECTWVAPDAACADHTQDSVVYCANADGSDSLQVFVRLICAKAFCDCSVSCDVISIDFVFCILL